MIHFSYLDGVHEGLTYPFFTIMQSFHCVDLDNFTSLNLYGPNTQSTYDDLDSVIVDDVLFVLQSQYRVASSDAEYHLTAMH